MELNSSVVKKFVELTKDQEESTGHYAYATAIVNGDDKYVQLDGSDSVTSVSIATDLETGDRVLVYIEDHIASVIGNITCPASGRTAIEVDERLLDFEELAVGYFQAIDAEIEYVKANYVDTEYLTANYVLTEYLTANYITADTIVSDYATIGSLTALWEYVDTLEASEITVDYLETNYANITDLNVLKERVRQLEATYVTIEYLEVNYATIDALEVTNAYISSLDSDYANIKNILAGYEGVGDLQSIHLTSENAVFENAVIKDAAIDSISANKITAGTIYTSLVRIQTAEGDTSLYLGDSLLQMSENELVRLQAGKDATGEYGFYIWDANGEIMFDATGATSNGIGKEVIVNTHVAEDANIAGYKLDIDSVISCINSNGNLEVDASHVTINGSTLDFEIDSIIDIIEGLELEHVVDDIIPYFAVNDSDTVPPVNAEEAYPAYADVARADYSYADVYDVNQIWTEDQPTVNDGQYLWVKFLLVYADGETEWTNPFLLSDGYLHRITRTIQTELEVVQGQITAKVWQTDIDEALTTAITDLWAEITVAIGDISLSVGQLTTDFGILSSSVSSIELTVDGMVTEVSSLTVDYSTLNSRVASITTDIDGITASVSSVEQTLNNLSIGGRNYLLNTRALTAKTGETTIGSSWSYYGLDENGYGVILGDATKASNNYVAFYTNVDATTDVFNNQNMIFSIDLYAPNATSLPRGYAVLFSVYGSNNGTSWSRRLYKTYYLNTTSDGTVINTGDIVDNEWFRLIIKFTPPSTVNESSWSGSGGLSSYSIVKYVAEFGLCSDNTVSDPIYIRKPKLEIGTVATDWSPAPEDNDVSEESVVEILKNNITLKTTSNTNGTASIVLSVDGEDAGSATEVITDAREAFENEKSSITISAGTITFNSGTLVVNSSNFSLTKDGDITAKSGTIGGLTIKDSYLYNSKSSFDDDSSGLYIGSDGISLGSIDDYSGHSMIELLNDGTSYILNCYLGNSIYMPYDSRDESGDSDNKFFKAISTSYSSGETGVSISHKLFIDNVFSQTDSNNGYNEISAFTYFYNEITVYGKETIIFDDASDSNGLIVRNDGSGNTYMQAICGWNNNVSVSLGVGSGGYNRGVYDHRAGKWIIRAGSDNVVTVNNVQILYGTVTISWSTSSSGGYTDVSVTFSTAFTSTPMIFVQMANSTTAVGYSDIAFTISSRSTSGFTLRALVNGSYTASPTIQWFAVGAKTS